MEFHRGYFFAIVGREALRSPTIRFLMVFRVVGVVTNSGLSRL
jgi:hypothetical protein